MSPYAKGFSLLIIGHSLHSLVEWPIETKPRRALQQDPFAAELFQYYLETLVELNEEIH